MDKLKNENVSFVFVQFSSKLFDRTGRGFSSFPIYDMEHYTYRLESVKMNLQYLNVTVNLMIKCNEK